MVKKPKFIWTEDQAFCVNLDDIESFRIAHYEASKDKEESFEVAAISKGFEMVYRIANCKTRHEAKDIIYDLVKKYGGTFV